MSWIKKQNKSSFYVALIIIFGIVFCIFIHNIYTEKIEVYKKNKLEELQLSYNIIINSYRTSSEIVFKEIISQPDIYRILEDANSSNPQLVDKARQSLLKKLYPAYENLQNLNFRQLHFHLPDNRSFLRFHRPQKYGDDLTEVRYSIKMTNRNLKPYYGFEEGRIFNGFRYVYPIINPDKQHLGSVEVSINSNVIKNALEEIFDKRYYHLIDKKIVDAKVFASEQSNYKQSSIHERFVYESYITPTKAELALNETINNKEKSLLSSYKPIVIYSKYNGENYIITFFPISNVEGLKSGYIISYEVDDMLHNIYLSYYLILSFVLLFFITITFLLIKLQKSNNQLTENQQQLKTSEKRLIILNKIIRHDISNDIAVIKSALRLYRKSNDDNMLNEIDNRVTKSLKTIAEFKKYQLFIESNKDLKIINISDQIKEVAKDFTDIDIEIKGEASILADDALYSVFTNLISNAIRHGNATKIDVIISAKNKLCTIQFNDNGKGIPDNVKNRIFEEGFTHSETGNTGIGLYIVKQTIEHYGGTVIVKDNEPKGASFVITLNRSITE